jgi:hypothetical protein
VQDERVGPDHIHGAAAMIQRVAMIELDRAQVGEQQNVRRDFSHLERGGLFGMFERGALAPDSHRHAHALGGFGETQVDRPSAIRPAGHGADQDGGAQGLAEQAEGRVDAV